MKRLAILFVVGFMISGAKCMPSEEHCVKIKEIVCRHLGDICAIVLENDKVHYVTKDRSRDFTIGGKYCEKKR